MTADERQLLTFKEVDGLAFAARRGRLNEMPAGIRFDVADLGPFMELARIAADGLLPALDRAPWLHLHGLGALYGALSGNRELWVCPESRQAGLFRTAPAVPDDETPWIGFCLAAQQAAVGAGFPRRLAAQIVAAFGEMQSNIYEHSGRPGTGLAAFLARGRSFEFVVSDEGIGVLDSLRCGPEYDDLTDHGEALRLALSEGVSRFGTKSGRGRGFRPLFVGLANRSASLRFRSGDHALTIDGVSPTLLAAKVAEKPPLSGFLASVACRPTG